MEPLSLRFADGLIEGDGQDCIGRFTFRGSYTDAGAVRMVKQYVGQHAVLYDGRVDGEGAVVGRWSVSPDWFGPFALMPVIESVEELPILTITAGAAEPGAAADRAGGSGLRGS
jgi:hypothetical protein